MGFVVDEERGRTDEEGQEVEEDEEGVRVC
jgi:hypothetical protein